MNELSALRQETNKTFELDPKLGLGQYQLEARTGPIHYKEAYRDADPWLDLDETYREDKGDHWFYPKLPNTVKVYKDLCAYEIQNRSNLAHVMKVELMRVNGIDVSRWLDDSDLSAYVKVHPYRVGIWKEFKRARAIPWRFRWKVTETGRDDKAVHLMSFKESIDAWSRVDLTNVDPDTVKVAVTGTRTRIDDNSWFWEELAPKSAMLVDTDYQTSSGNNDGYVNTGSSSFDKDLTYCIIGKGTSSNVYCNFQLFNSVNIPKNSNIDSASMSFRASTSLSGTTVNLNIYAEAADNPSTCADYNDYVGRSVGSACGWSSVEAWTFMTWYTTPSISSIIQAVVDRSGWASGNNMQLFVKESSSSSNCTRRNNTYNSNSAYGPKLTVTWTESAPMPLRFYYNNNIRP